MLFGENNWITTRRNWADPVELLLWEIACTDPIIILPNLIGLIQPSIYEVGLNQFNYQGTEVGRTGWTAGNWCLAKPTESIVNKIKLVQSTWSGSGIKLVRFIWNDSGTELNRFNHHIKHNWSYWFYWTVTLNLTNPTKPSYGKPHEIYYTSWTLYAFCQCQKKPVNKPRKPDSWCRQIHARTSICCSFRIP